MKLVGKRSVASVLRWILGFVNIFVMIGAVATVGVFVASLIVPDFGAGVIDALNDIRHDAGGTFGLVERLTLLGAVLACGFTWWIINRLRRILLAVNLGDAFEPANVRRLQAVGLGLIGIQLTSIMLAFTASRAIGEATSDYNISLGSWLGILVVFILAEVFRQGSDMRHEQQTTV
ncbi:DUF2975 domain-containing protein [soil metagenome]